MKRQSSGSWWRLFAIGWLVGLTHSGIALAEIHSGLQVRYRFDDGGGTTATDSSTNSGRDGALTNGAHFIPSGRVGGAVEMDGMNGFRRLPTDWGHRRCAGAHRCVLAEHN